MRALPLPPISLAVGLGLQHLIARHRSVTPVSAAAAVVLAGASASLAAGSVREFRRQRTTYDPIEVTAATSLVTTGANSVTRNPMYVGLAGLLLAHATLRRSARALVPVAAFLALIDRVQIRAEEQALGARFSHDYERYRRSVPRWLGTRSVGAWGDRSNTRG